MILFEAGPTPGFLLTGRNAIRHRGLIAAPWNGSNGGRGFPPATVEIRLFRRILPAAAILACLCAGPALAQGAGQTAEWRHATALLGQPKYPAGFPHFD